MDVEKTAAITKWPIPKNLCDIQSFLGFANFYRQFIATFSDIILPLTQLTRKGTPFSWEAIHQDTFETLKTAFSQAPVLIHFDPNNPIVVETDTSDYAIAAILSQITPSNGYIHPVTFYSRGLAPAEMNYEIYNKELLAIFGAFKQWRNYLKGACAYNPCPL